ncbi:hypothetical protein FB45DRAFT_926543 [Roridomyces roridus]|uniref:Fungal-type protein kinase domain-containing protein n=1 Tax=Roridomyces roridus TaxID=1738132 RepID=A0AAD7BL32_9AGAR|nr:hypothetical protein FB45DRAFT_926543 [Roridomyces roridus]
MRASELDKSFAGIKPVAQFLDEFMGAKTPDTLERSLRGASAALKGKTPLFSYLCKVASRIPGHTRPMLFDTSKAQFPSMIAGWPQITVTKPWVTEVPKSGWTWWHAATVIELMSANNDVFDRRDAIRDYDAVAHLAATARNLLVESGLCHVYIIVIFKTNHTRIFRFDRSSFSSSTAFHVVEEPTYFATFLWRLFNPSNGSYILGMDDTITFAVPNDKRIMYAEICKHPVYSEWSYEQATRDSLWITAVRYKEGTREPQLVHCFTFGGIIAHSDGLFSRATRVYRVLIAEDLDLDRDATEYSPIPVYALKDAWSLKGHRPEVDFYDMIAKYCADDVAKDPENEQRRKLLDSIAKCHGSIDLSSANSPVECDRDLHQSHPTTEHPARYHTRLLLTPVGAPLRKCDTTQSLLEAIMSGMFHHFAAYNAGVLHRDISEGNILLREVPDPDPHPQNQGFLVDWDNAQFTKEGAIRFNQWFPDRTPANLDEVQASLQKLAGTFPFMAIQFIHNPLHETVVHSPHHDLESFYWLLVWMVLRYSAVTLGTGTGTAHSWCERLFEDPYNDTAKLRWVQGTEIAPIDKGSNPPLYELLERLRKAVDRQNPENPVDRPFIALKYPKMISWIQKAMQSSEWPEGGSSVIEDVAMPDLDEDAATVLDAANGGESTTVVDITASPEKRKGGKTESPAKRRKRN